MIITIANEKHIKHCEKATLALDIDYAALTDAELDELIREATAERSSRQTVHVPVAVNPSPDKYTWYVQDYVGRNAAGFGYTSLGGDRLEKYGAGYLEFIFVTEDGMYIDIEDESLLQQYIVTGQNLAPNTEMKYIFRTDSKGNEYSNLIDFQSQRLIDLTVRRIDGTLAGDPIAFELIPINPAPDKYTCYIRNYVGKNVLSFGYTSLGGDRRDEYGATSADAKQETASRHASSAAMIFFMGLLLFSQSSWCARNERPQSCHIHCNQEHHRNHRFPDVRSLPGKPKT